MIDPALNIMTFPCKFPLKAFGKNTDDFEALIITIVRRHVPYLEDQAVSSRLSRGGAYRAVTATFTAHSRAQLDALYLELSNHEQVLMLL